MQTSTVVKSHILVIGVSTKVAYREDHSAPEIDQLWEKFFSEDVFNKIPGKANDAIVGLYYDYEKEGDEIKSFHYLLGCEVTSFAQVPPGMVAQEIPSSSYAYFVPKGKFPEALRSTWKSISNSLLKRLFSGDLEIYTTENGKPNYNDVTVYVSVE